MITWMVILTIWSILQTVGMFAMLQRMNQQNVALSRMAVQLIDMKLEGIIDAEPSP